MATEHPDESYDGPVCYVGHDHDSADGRPLSGGWHYTAEDGVPGERLVHDPETGRYRLADATDRSHRDRHHSRLTTVAVMGSLGEPRTDEEYDAAYRHLDELAERLEREGTHPHEHDHLIRTPEQARVMKEFVRQARGQG